jgi:hypothetical protein
MHFRMIANSPVSCTFSGCETLIPLFVPLSYQCCCLSCTRAGPTKTVAITPLRKTLHAINNQPDVALSSRMPDYLQATTSSKSPVAETSSHALLGASSSCGMGGGGNLSDLPQTSAAGRKQDQESEDTTTKQVRN